jgi:hypothetical protein
MRVRTSASRPSPLVRITHWHGCASGQPSLRPLHNWGVLTVHREKSRHGTGWTCSTLFLYTGGESALRNVTNRINIALYFWYEHKYLVWKRQLTAAFSMSTSSYHVKCKIMFSWRNIHVGDFLPRNISFPTEASELMLNRIRNGSKQDVQ